jgi:hypothetical protein
MYRAVQHPAMKTILLASPFLAAVALIVYVEGWLNPFAAWNALPVVAGFGLLVSMRRSEFAVVVGCTMFAMLATLLVVLFHLSWLFDWGGTATGSSTSGLAFIFLPFYAFVLAGIAGAAAWGVGKIVGKWIIRADRHIK